jgi:hypothetical protein
MSEDNTVAPDEAMRRNLNLKQKILEKLDVRTAAQTLADGDIRTSTPGVRVPKSRLFGARAANAVTEVAVADSDPRDSILYSDFDFSPDPVTVTDVDPTDSSHHPFPA